MMGGKPCFRWLRVTVEIIVGLVAEGYSNVHLSIENRINAGDVWYEMGENLRTI
ncbi:MAG: DUF433 domain-containing protein [Nitrospirae bacterium]|nr:DUF433 domain-containing protein [Nitrospirota bacterium]